MEDRSHESYEFIGSRYDSGIFANPQGLNIAEGAGQEGSVASVEAVNVNQEMAKLGYTADSLKGFWIEKITGRGYIAIEEGPKAGTYYVSIRWNNSASEAYIWHMTAEPISSHAIGYTNGKHFIITYSEDGTESEELKYENGTGTLTLNSANEIMWQDDVDGAGRNTVFVSK